ncbi:MAG TPA: hypothetical protein VN745_00355 [Verrucomicrobiae bacterium]|nr:hypothetical protein [Verrucomicrobiae bacterium]
MRCFPPIVDQGCPQSLLYGSHGITHNFRRHEEDMHYHIRWSGSRLDWERFGTRQEAEKAASQLARPGETFTLEQVDDNDCIACLKVRKRVLGNDKTGDAEVRS